MLASCFHEAFCGSYSSAIRRGPKPQRRTGFTPSTAGTIVLKSISFASAEPSAGHTPTVSRRKPAAIAAKRTCFITASSSVSGRAAASHQRTHHWKTASSLLATSPSSCTGISTSAPVASCGGSSSKPRSAASTAAFSSAGSVKVSASRTRVERVGRREALVDRVGARVLEGVDHEARGRLEHLGQQALVDLARALVDKGQQRLERGRVDALERMGGI
eukprot:scaffold28188_cov66-Phaeocystis_antarctica.AAC.5